MKKLELKKLKLEANDVLQRNQLKNVFGGYGGYSGNTGLGSSGGTCCSAWVTYEGETFEALEVCGGTSYVVNCLVAEDWLDLLIS